MNAMTDALACNLDREDTFNQDAVAALAILNCVRVLCALERTPALRGADLMPGHGYAAGECTSDSSMPAALHHAMQLVRHMQDTGGAAMQEVRKFSSVPGRCVQA